MTRPPSSNCSTGIATFAPILFVLECLQPIFHQFNFSFSLMTWVSAGFCGFQTAQLEYVPFLAAKFSKTLGANSMSGLIQTGDSPYRTGQHTLAAQRT